jgi:hypothetical protein
MIAPHTVRDRIAFRSSLRPLKVPSFQVIDALQKHPADVQVEALALTLAIITRTLGIDAHDLLTRANRQLTDADAVRNPHIEAIASYASGELR